MRAHLYPVQQYVYNNETRLSLTLPKTSWSPIKYLSIRFFLTNSTVHFWALSYIYFCSITNDCCTLHCPLLFFEWHTKPTETSHFAQLYPYYSNVSLIIVDSVPWDHPPNLQALQRTHSWETALKYKVSWTEAVWTWPERLIWEMKKKREKSVLSCLSYQKNTVQQKKSICLWSVFCCVCHIL